MTPIDIPRLRQAMKFSRRALQRYRTNRREAVRQYVGKNWSEDGARTPVPVNLLALYVKIMSRNLIAKNPRLLYSTFNRQAKPAVHALESWANRQIEKISLEETLRRIAIDALFSIGVAKVCLTTPAESALTGWVTQPGEPTVSRVSLDDFVVDMHATDPREVSYIGHRFRVPLEVVRSSKLYRGGRELQPADDMRHNTEGDERTKVLGRGTNVGETEEYEDFVNLWEIYLPRRRVVVTLTDDDSGSPVLDEVSLREQEWVGPYCGPYHLLCFDVVPDNLMPKGPIMDLVDLHEQENRIYRKLNRQSDRQKEVGIVAAGATEDGSRALQANDGEFIRADNPAETKLVSFGGVNQQNLAYGIHIKDLFSYLSGNLDMMGGLSPQSKTLGQDRLLAANASGGVSDMQDRMVAFTAAVARSLSWYWWHDPFTTQKTSYSPPGMPELSMPRQVTPLQRAGVPFEELDIDIDPYSLQFQPPQARLQTLNQVLQQIVIPLMPILGQQGIMLDMNAYLSKVAKYLDMPDLPEILTIAEPGAAQSSGPGEQPGMPQSTERRYVRENMPGRTERGDNMNMINSLMGIDAGGAPSTNGAMH